MQPKNSDHSMSMSAMPTPPRVTDGTNSIGAASGTSRLAKFTHALPTMQTIVRTMAAGCR